MTNLRLLALELRHDALTATLADSEVLQEFLCEHAVDEIAKQLLACRAEPSADDVKAFGVAILEAVELAARYELRSQLIEKHGASLADANEAARIEGGLPPWVLP